MMAAIGGAKLNLLRRRWLGHVLSLLTIVLAVTACAFLITGILPGDLAVAILGENATPAEIEALRQELGLDRAIPVRYFEWLGQAINGDLGYSYRSNERVGTMIVQRLPVSLELIIFSQIIALAMAVPAGILAAYRVGGLFDRLTGFVAIAKQSTPAFLIGILLIYGFSVNLGLLPASGFKPVSAGWAENLKSMLLPALTLAIAEFPVYMRLLRADMIQTLQQDFILTARAKGMRPRHILLQHALKPSSFSLVTVVGVNMGRLIGGAVIIETLFALPGMGQMLVTAVYQHDHHAIQGVVLVVAVGFVAINVLVDCAYALLDPRVRHALHR